MVIGNDRSSSDADKLCHDLSAPSRGSQAHFEKNGASINYSLVLEDRKSITATVFPTRAVLVKAPTGASEERIQDFLRRKFNWILKQQRYFAQFKTSGEKLYVSGESFRYRGRSYKLLIRRDSGKPRVSLQHGTLIAYTSDPVDKSAVRKLIDRWYAGRAKLVFKERLAACLPLFNYSEMPTLEIRQLRKRWGSYTRRSHKIILNLDLILGATRHIDYVIIHELCHVTHQHHGPEFRTLLASRLPDWEKLKTELELSLLG